MSISFLIKNDCSVVIVSAGADIDNPKAQAAARLYAQEITRVEKIKKELLAAETDMEYAKILLDKETGIVEEARP